MKLTRRTLFTQIASVGSLLALHAQEPAKNGEKKDGSAPRRWGAAPAAEFTPQRTMLGWLGDPAHTQAITWRTARPAEMPQVQYAFSSANPDFIKGATVVAGKSSSLQSDTGASVAMYRANLEGLEPDTRYHYRVGDGKNWGEWSTFRTASEKPNRFRFLYVGDAQNDIKSRWSRVIRAAYARLPRAAFIVHAGDLVSSGYRDDLWDEWYDSMGFIAENIPALPIVGNHELEKPSAAPKTLDLPVYWKPQFAYPANGPDIPENESYYIDYQGVRFLCLNVNMLENEKEIDSKRAGIDQFVAWVERALKNKTTGWTIVCQHQGMYSMAQKRNYKKMRELLLPVYEKYGVDLVLQGHDHLYARSKKLVGGQVVAADAPGIVYMISVSGPKMYEVDHDLFEPLMAKVISNTQMFQTIDVEPGKLVLRAYSSEDELLDGFQLEKKNGRSVYSELPKPAASGTSGE